METPMEVQKELFVEPASVTSVPSSRKKSSDFFTSPAGLEFRLPTSTSEWKKYELEQLELVKRGLTAVGSHTNRWGKSGTPNLAKWAIQEKIAVDISRRNKDVRSLGNPFILDAPNNPGDGTLDEVINMYDVYLASRPTLRSQVLSIRGRVLLCYCQPKHRCHGNLIAEIADGTRGFAQRILESG